jgi:diguanylate cyclase (GGDEF)-like protein
MLGKIIYILSINLFPILLLSSIKIEKFKKLFYIRDFILAGYLVVFSFLLCFSIDKEIFIVFVIIITFLWMAIFEMYNKRTKEFSFKFADVIRNLILQKDNLQEKILYFNRQYLRYQAQFDRYTYLFGLAQEINENVELDKILKEFYVKIVSYLGENRIFYIFLVTYKKKDIINIIEYPKYKDIKDFVKKYLTEKENIMVLENSNLLFYEIYSDRYNYMLVIDCAKDEFLISELNFFVSETRLGFVRAILFGEVEELSRIDGLTQLYLRRYFINRLNDELLKAVRYNTEFSLIMIDIDFFKKINDTYGHLAGDFILKQVAKVIKDVVGEKGLCARWGGEEFLVFIPYQSSESAKNLAEELRQRIETINFYYEDKIIRLTISCGISSFPQEGQQLQVLIETADKKLYKAKRSGRNKVLA